MDPISAVVMTVVGLVLGAVQAAAMGFGLVAGGGLALMLFMRRIK